MAAIPWDMKDRQVNLSQSLENPHNKLKVKNFKVQQENLYLTSRLTKRKVKVV